MRFITAKQVRSIGFCVLVIFTTGFVPYIGVKAENLPNFRIQAGTLQEDFENIGDWTITGTGGSGEIDAVHYKSGAGSLKLTSVNNVSAYARKNVNWDLSSASRFGIWVYIDDKTKYSNVTTGLLQLHNTDTNYFVYSIARGNATAELLQNGWNYKVFEKADFTNNNTPSWDSAITQIRIRSLSNAGNTVSLSVDNFVVDPYTKPKCILSFDDGSVTNYTEAYPYLASKGFKGSLFVPMNNIDGSGYITTAQATEMYNAGWDIGSHSYTHVNLTSLSIPDATAEMQTEINALDAAGFTRSSRHMAWPFSAYNDDLMAAAASVGMLTARTGNDRVQPNYTDDYRRLFRYEITNTRTLTDYQAITEKAISLGGLVYFNLHKIVTPAAQSTDITPTDFQALIDYIKTKSDAGLIDVVTISEWYNGLSGSLTAPTIGTPTVNSASSITWNWTDNSSLEDSYRIDYVNNGGGTGTDVDGLSAGAQTYVANGLSANTQYSIQAHAYLAEIGESPASATSAAVYTLANTPNAPTVNTATTTANVNPVSGGVESAMAIYVEAGSSCDGTGGLGYVQADGSISGSAVWRTDADWGTITVTGLSLNTQYSFCAKSRNGDAIESVFGVSSSGTTNNRGKRINDAPVDVRTPSVIIDIPRTSASYKTGSVIGLSWTPFDGAFVKYKASYSRDNGATWAAVGETSSTALSWTVPNAGTAQGKIKIEGFDAAGSLLASATNTGNFTVIGEAVTGSAETRQSIPPVVDQTATGTYTPAEALGNTPSIDADKGLVAPAETAACSAGSLIKGSLPAIYYCGADGKRYVFVNDRAFFSWFDGFEGVEILSDVDLAKIPLGGNVTYRPGKKMIKIQSDPRVYVIARGGILRWVQTESKARELYGDDWNKQIDDISDAFFTNYTIGSSL